MRIAWTIVPAPAPIRKLTVGLTEAGVAYVSFGDGISGLVVAARRAGGTLVTGYASTDRVARQFTDYFAGERRTFDLPVDWSMTSGVRRTVLMTLHGTVGYGNTITYGELASRSGAFDDSPEHQVGAARAVGSIMGANPIPVIVPCHRVLAADGLGGFGGGLDLKRWLLTLEGVLTPSLNFEAP